MSRRETEDGTYYYVELVRRRGGLPSLLRTRLESGLPHDEAWRVDTDTWVATDRLSQYRLYMEENEIRPVTERLAVEIQERDTARWRADHEDE